MSSVLKKSSISIGILALAVLITWVYVAQQPQVPLDDPATILDERIATSQGTTVRLVHPIAPEKGILYFVSDDSPADITTAYAKQFAALSYYVVVLQSNTVLKDTGTDPSTCLNVSASIQELQDALREQLNVDQNMLPILVGMNDGAAIVYTALAQGNTHRFHAAISINFSGQLHSDVDLCAADDFVKSAVDGLIILSPVERLPSRWYLFQDKDFTPAIDTCSFADQIVNAKFTAHPGTDKPIIAAVLQVLQWLDPGLLDQLSADNADSQLPLMTVPSTADRPSKTMAIMLTGDGGWAEIDKGIATILAEKGIPTVALDSLSYFWKKRTPDEAARDIENTITEYLEKWDKKQVILIGYSFGADVLPFIANRIHPEHRKDIALIAMLGIGKSAAFEFHLSNWVDIDDSAGRLPLPPEVRKMDWARSVCIYGFADKDADCAALGELGVKVISITGDHHFDEKYNDVVQHILDNIDTK